MSRLFALTCLIFSVPGQAAIFGVDDRLPVTPDSPFQAQGHAVAIGVLRPSSKVENGKLILDTDSLADHVCQEERFSRDPSLAYACTGFLVAPDLLVTAGHCSVNHGEIRDETGGYCEVYDWAFGFQRNANGALADIPADELYRCKKILHAVAEEKFPFRDFALIQLDRPVKGRSPLKLSAETVAPAENLSMLGYPLGTPLKLSRNAKVLLDRPTWASFMTSLDAFDGNSGSPVFNEKKEVVGILVNGTPSSIFAPSGSCSIYNRCDEKGENCLVPEKEPDRLPGFQAIGSGVQRIGPILELLKSPIDGSWPHSWQ